MPQCIPDDNSRVICKDAQTARCQIQQVIDYMAQDLYRSSNRTGDTKILR